MQPPPAGMPENPSGPAPALPRSEPLWRWIAGVMFAVMGIILLVCLEFVIGVGAQTLTRGTGYEKPVYYGLRVAAYLLLFGMAVWLVRQFVAPERRRKYWIGLGIATAIMISPAGLSLFAMALLGGTALFIN